MPVVKTKQDFKKLDTSFLMSEFYLYDFLWALIISWLGLNFREKECACVVSSPGIP